MAGIRQHFIPQFLQVGFLSHRVGDAAFTWVFRRGSAPFNPNIQNSGLERHFYTEQGDASVDDSITEAEGHFASLVRRLKEVPAGSLTEEQLPEFISHLEVRTRHLRESFIRSGTYLVDRLLEIVSDTDAFVEFLRRKIAADPAYMRQIVNTEIAKLRLSPVHQAESVNAIMRASHKMLPELLENMKPGLKQMADELRKSIPSILSKAAKAGHLRGLKQTIAPQPRTDTYAKLRYRLVDVNGVDFILGDSALLFKTGGNGKFRTFTGKDVSIDAVFLPLTPTRIVIGEMESAEVDFNAINKQMARCSLEYFIGHENTKENRALQAEIGSDAELLAKDELDAIVLDAFAGLERPENGVNTRK